MQGAPGNRYLIRKRLRRLERLRWRLRIHRSFTWGRARRTCARTFPTGMGCTGPPTAGRRGRALGWRIRGRLREFLSIRAIQKKCLWGGGGRREGGQAGGGECVVSDGGEDDESG